MSVEYLHVVWRRSTPPSGVFLGPVPLDQGPDQSHDRRRAGTIAGTKGDARSFLTAWAWTTRFRVAPDLAVNKVLALVGRDETRDVVDDSSVSLVRLVLAMLVEGARRSTLDVDGTVGSTVLQVERAFRGFNPQARARFHRPHDPQLTETE